MSDNLLKIYEKKKLCEYKAAHPKKTAKQLIEFCVNEFKKKPSKAQLRSRVSGRKSRSV
jgi:hypothetical protein